MNVPHVNMSQSRHVRSSFGRWGWQNVHEAVARARFHIKFVKQVSASEHIWKMRSAKCAQDCSESSVSHKNLKKLRVSEHCWKMRSADFIH